MEYKVVGRPEIDNRLRTELEELINDYEVEEALYDIKANKVVCGFPSFDAITTITANSICSSSHMNVGFFECVCRIARILADLK